MFRALGKSKIAIVLAILFGISLFFFRGSSRYSNLFNSDNVVASVSGTPISTSKFKRTMQLNINQFSQMLGKELTGDEIRAFQIHSLSLGNLINHAVFENEFDKNLYLIDETVVAKKTKERLPNLYNGNKLNQQSLNNFLKNQGLVIDDLVNIINYEIREENFDNLFFKIKYPKKINNKINLYNMHKRNINLTQIPIKSISLDNINESQVTKNNIELINYYEQNTNQYKSPELRDASYIIIDQNNYIKEFEPSEIEINNYYNNNKPLFLIPEKRNFYQFNFKTVDNAEEFKKIISDFDYKDVINYAIDNQITYNEFNNLSINEVLDELANVIFELDIGEISDVVTTTLANHVIIVDKIINESYKNYKDSKDNIKKTLMNIELESFVSELKNKVSQEILNGLSIDEIAANNSLNVEKMYKIEKQNSDNDLIKKQIINQIFASNIDFVSDLYEFDNEKSFLINVKKVYPSETIPLEDVFEDVLKDWLDSKKIELVENYYNKNIDERILEKISSKFNSSIQKNEIDKNFLNYPKSFINKIFNANINESIFFNDNNLIYIAKIHEIKIPQENNIEIIPINLDGILKNALGNELISNKKITTNNSLLEALILQY